MLSGIKRTKNNDLVINNKGLSVLNILFIISALLLLFFFIPLLHINVDGFLFEIKKSFSMYGIMSFDPGTLGATSDIGQLRGFQVIFFLFLIYPIANIVMWVLNKKAAGKKSYIFVHVIYILNISFGFLHLCIVNTISSLNIPPEIRVSIFTYLLILILLVNIVLSVFGILKTGFAQIDEDAVAMDLNVGYAKDILNKAGNMASTVAGNVSAAANKAVGSGTITCDACGNICSESAGFCTRCGNNLDNARKIKAASKIANSNKVVCDNCGIECPESAGFCTRCGNNLENAKKIKAEQIAAAMGNASQNVTSANDNVNVAESNISQSYANEGVNITKSGVSQSFGSTENVTEANNEINTAVSQNLTSVNETKDNNSQSFPLMNETANVTNSKDSSSFSFLDGDSHKKDESNSQSFSSVDEAAKIAREMASESQNIENVSENTNSEDGENKEGNSEGVNLLK